MTIQNMQKKTVAIGCDHAGVAFKTEIVEHLRNQGYKIEDFGCFEGEKCDYPDVAKLVCDRVVLKDFDVGILICGTGIGISMSANKVKGIRAALCSDDYSAKYTRLHNDANVLCMGARVIGSGVACELCDIFLTTDFEGGRHTARVEKISALDER